MFINKSYGVILDSDHTEYQSSNHMFGALVYTAKNSSEFHNALEKAFDEKGPVIIEAIIDPQEYDELVLKGNR